jgi:hypothetical protein
MNMDSVTADLLKELGQVISGSLAESRDIASVVDALQRRGCMVSASVDVVVCASCSSSQVADPEPDEDASPGNLVLTVQDQLFLESLRIAV